jgi:hypothetical protein
MLESAKERLIAESALSCPPADMMVSSGDALLLHA